MRKVKYYLIAALAALIIYFWASPRRSICVLNVNHLTIASLQYGRFSESIPQSGVFIRDTVEDINYVKVTIDELYLPRIVTGLNATTTINNSDYVLEITRVYPKVVNGRFDVEMKFNKEPSLDMVNRNLRMRIELSEPTNALLLPVGGFYKDTGGKWIFLVEGSRAVRRNIKLGRKNPVYFEVLEGLSPGDTVITSSYENFNDRESFDVNELNEEFDVVERI